MERNLKCINMESSQGSGLALQFSSMTLTNFNKTLYQGNVQDSTKADGVECCITQCSGWSMMIRATQA